MPADRVLISLAKVRELDLSAPTSTARTAHLSAASGLVRAGRFLYVVADDELHLGVFHATEAKAGHLIRLFPGELPAPANERKARKPDLEALALLPSFAGYPHGALLALGSGSKRKRRMGALLALDVQGEAGDTPQLCDLSGLFSVPEEIFAALNIEGAVVLGDELCLLQRGNKRTVENAVIRFHLPELLDALGAGLPIAASASLIPSAICAVALGEINGIPLCFTDAAALPSGELAFSAIAEDTEDNYNDGPCKGAAIGIADRQGRLRCLYRLDRPHKIEGIDARVEGDVIRLLLVTDADDAAIPASLYSATMPF
jgi:uncharacterized protein DUF6929